ncbi:MAG: PilZ domain-containing protein, partial [Terriglobia bacterium]
SLLLQAPPIYSIVTINEKETTMPTPKPSERRRSERAVVNRPVALLVDSSHDQIAHNAFAIDLSEVGARLRAGIDLTPGQLVTIIPNEGTAQSVKSQVIWVGEKGSERSGEAGLAFLQPLAVSL